MLIYDLLLVTDGPIAWSCPYLRDRDGSDEPPVRPPSLSTNILRLNRQINLEARKSLYETNRFQLWAGQWFPCSRRDRARMRAFQLHKECARELSKLVPSPLCHITDLTVSVFLGEDDMCTLRQPQQCLNAVSAELRKTHRLRRLCIQIHRLVGTQRARYIWGVAYRARSILGPISHIFPAGSVKVVGPVQPQCREWLKVWLEGDQPPVEKEGEARKLETKYQPLLVTLQIYAIDKDGMSRLLDVDGAKDLTQALCRY